MPTKTKSPRYAVIIADPNSSDLGEIFSQHRSSFEAAKSFNRLGNIRWAYVAKQQPDGSYPLRDEALRLPAHNEIMDIAIHIANGGR